MPRFEDRESSLEDRIISLLSSPRYQPLKQHELAAALYVKHSHRQALRQALHRLEREGRISCLRKNRWALRNATQDILGKLSVHPSGFGFVVPEEGTGPDIFIGREEQGVALHGDRVLARVTGRKRPDPRSGETEERVSGRIVRVVERTRTRLAGILRSARYYWYVIPDDARIGRDIKVREFKDGLPPPRDIRKVVVELDPWEDPRAQLCGVVVEDLGEPDAKGVDVVSVLRNHGLYEEFEDDVVREATSIRAVVTDHDLRGRRDLRKDLIITIDPEDAKDFDDAISLVRRPGGGWDVGVHIADVSHFVAKGAKVDKEAHIRGNSVYMVDRHVPMLPKYLTSDVCSLRPHMDRLTHSVALVLDDHGDVVSHETFPSVIHSAARLTYDEVQAYFDGKPDHGVPANLLPMIDDMRALARSIRRKRMKNGAMDLSMPEIKCELDDFGRPIGFHKRGAKEAYNLIEEFMLLANVAVAEIMAKKEVPALYRIHEPPTDEMWEQMAMDLRNLGLVVSPGDRAGINRVARDIAGTPLEYAGNLAILKNLKRALYSPERIEHFGLAFESYTHFTSPIRRFPDLIVHRILKAIEQRQAPPYSFADIDRLARHCCDTERNAADAEDESLAVKRIEYYATLLEQKDVGPFAGMIVALVPKGLIVEVSDSLQRGLVPLGSMREDRYTIDVPRGRVIGRHGGQVYKIGQRVQVELVRVDVYRKLVDFKVVATEGVVATGETPRKRGKRHRTR